jgi:conjugative transposon TraM protein
VAAGVAENKTIKRFKRFSKIKMITMNNIKNRKIKKIKKLLLLVSIFLASFAGVFYLAITAGNRFGAGDTGKDSVRSAFNKKLPSANTKDPEKNKLEIYMEAREDSAKRKEALDKDPYEKGIYDPNEKKANDRLEKLYSVLNQNTQGSKPLNKGSSMPAVISRPQEQSTRDLEKLMASLQSGNSTPDPEMKRIEGVLDKVLDIQHPDRIRNRDRGNSPSRQRPALNVTIEPAIADSLLKTFDSSDLYNTGVLQNRFYALEGEPTENETGDSGTILTVVHGDQIIHDGAKARLRLLQDIFIGNSRIAKDNFIYGICSIGNERVNIRVDNITVSNNIYPIHLTAFGNDGMEGVDVPGAVGQQAGKEGLSQALQNIELFNTDPSIGSQAAAASVQTVKSLMSKKVKQLSATLKTGQIVLLRNGQ